MLDSMDVAAVQMNSAEDKRANLADATRLVQQAAADGAHLVVLPELFNCIGRFETVLNEAEPIPGPTSQAMGALAARLGITLCAGSICQQSRVPDKGYNTSLLFGPDGQLLARYRKIHLFDVDLPSRVTVCESRFMLSGDEIVSTETSLAHLGQATCYDLRFPELFRALSERGAELVLIPAAFTHVTGRDHWEVLLRARAIENQVFVIAPNQCGRHAPGLVSYGRSAIIDPWGRLLAVADEETPQVIFARLERALLLEVRRDLPALSHRRRLGA